MSSTITLNDMSDFDFDDRAGISSIIRPTGRHLDRVNLMKLLIFFIINNFALIMIVVHQGISLQIFDWLNRFTHWSSQEENSVLFLELLVEFREYSWDDNRTAWIDQIRLFLSFAKLTHTRHLTLAILYGLLRMQSIHIEWKSLSFNPMKIFSVFFFFFFDCWK